MQTTNNNNDISSPIVVIYKAFCLDVAQGHMNGVPNQTQL